MRSKFRLLILLLVLIASTAMLRATDLRGGVQGLNPYTGRHGPLPGLGVGLFAQLSNGSFVLVSQTVTGPDGLYYFKGIVPGPYVLQIAGVNYPLGVANVPQQDIPIISR